MTGTLHIGTSGWSYDDWRGAFYPEGLSAEARLRHYAQHFSSVEINNSFYQLPATETLVRWRDAVPEGFTFAVKASRYITHLKKLKDPHEPLQTLYERVSVLGAALGPILFQLPPNWRFNAERLARFLEALSDAHRHAVELRDARWITPEALDLLEAHGAAFCIYDFRGRLAPRAVTADFAYIRLHGPHKTPYRGAYPTQTLAGWAGALATWRRQGRDVYCYFDNPADGQAPRDAAALQAMCENGRG